MMKSAAAKRRVVVTGMGAITPLGQTLMESWQTLVGVEKEAQNQTQNSAFLTLEHALQLQELPSGIFDNERKIAKTLPCQVAAPISNIPYDARTSRFIQLALQAGEEAVQQSKLQEWLTCGDDEGGADNDGDESSRRKRERVGVCVGSGMSSVREIVEASRTVFENESIRRLSPHFVPKVLANSAAARLALQYKLCGPNHAASTACAASAHSIGDAMRCIQYGDADVMLAGGAEACIDPLSMAGFCRLRALSTNFNEEPSKASRPFDTRRDGFVMGEGASILVLEELEHAKQRGVPILAELRGYGLTGDGYHITSPDPQGRGAKRAMSIAIANAGLDVNQVDYVNAHATSTPMGDEIESAAINDTIMLNASSISSNSCREYDLYVSSTKGATGHLLGAAGATEAAFTVMSLIEGSIPATRNLEELDDKDADNIQFQHVQEESSLHFTDRQLKVAMSNSFGFGGTNASLVFTQYNHDDDNN